MTSSARPSSDGGMVSPSTLAVLRTPCRGYRSREHPLQPAPVVALHRQSRIALTSCRSLHAFGSPRAGPSTTPQDLAPRVRVLSYDAYVAPEPARPPALGARRPR